MGLSENPKIRFLVYKFFKKSKLIGFIITLIGFIYFLVFNKLAKEATIDSRVFSIALGNSTLNENDELFFKKVNNYFLNYEYNKKHIIDVLFEYIKKEIPLLDVEKHKINIKEFKKNNNINIDDYILTCTVPCKFCNPYENIIIVINFDYNEKKYFHSISVALTLINFFMNCEYMSKDIIFIFTNQELLYSSAINKFIEQFFYSNINKKYITRAAVILEINSIYPSFFKLNYESLNGLLANQDFIYLLTAQISHYKILVRTNSIYEAIFNIAIEKKYENGHIHFLRQNIPSFTIEGTSKLPISSKMMNLFLFVKAMESFIRTLSNTHEAFCHSTSFFFYDTVKKYVPISIYAVCVYLISSYNILKILRSKLFRNILNILIGIFIYIINILIISFPLYLFSTNDKIYENFNFQKNILCSQWHYSEFDEYIKNANRWMNIFFICIIIAFILNYFFNQLINKLHKKKKFMKSQKIERIIILMKIQKLNSEKNKLSEEYIKQKDNNDINNNNNKIKNFINKCKRIIKMNIIKNNNHTNHNDNNHNNHLKATNNIKPKVIHSDDEDLILDKINYNKLKELKKKIKDKKNKLKCLNDNENIKYINFNCIGSYYSIMKQTNIFFFIFSVLLLSVYNWSLALVLSLIFSIPISLQCRINKNNKKNIYRIIFLSFFIFFTLFYLYPYEDFIYNYREKMTNFIMNNLKKCEHFLKTTKISKLKHFPIKSFSFLCSNKLFDHLYLNKYYINNKNKKYLYGKIIKNNILLNLYNLARNHKCIGTQIYPVLCFILIPIFFHMLLLFIL